VDAALTVGLVPESVRGLALPKPAPWTPRLYAGFGGQVGGGLGVPGRLRPSPLEYVFRILGDPALNQPVAQHLSERRFEFLDFDVV
jgi:hypothetical protein